MRMVEFKKTHKVQFAKCVALLQQYAIVSTHVKLLISNSNGENMPFTPVFRTATQHPRFNPECPQQWLEGFGQNILSVLGRQKFNNLVQFSAGDLPGC